MDAHPLSRQARLDELSRRFSPDRIADVWLFPPLNGQQDSSEFVLFTGIGKAQERVLYSAEIVSRNEMLVHQLVTEHGRAPANRIPKLVAGIQRRLGEPVAVQHVPIGGDPGRWESLVAESSRESPKLERS